MYRPLVPVGPPLQPQDAPRPWQCVHRIRRAVLHAARHTDGQGHFLYFPSHTHMIPLCS
jgi:hypothetical protein